MTKRSEFYQFIGEVTALAQYLELDLGTIFLAAEADQNKWYASPIDNAEAYNHLLEKVNKNTLGKTLRNIQEKYDLLDEFTELMVEALEARNRFTHHIFREFGLAIHSGEGRDQMLQVVDQLRASMQRAEDIASMVAERLVLEHLNNADHS